MINSKANNSVNEMFEAAQSCFNYWKFITVKQRTKYVRILREIIVEKQKEILHCIISDTSKPITEIVNQEITATLAMLKFMEKAYPRWLKPKNFYYFKPGFWTKTNQIVYEPIGIIGILGPSNFPFSLPVMQTISVILAGNSVILKPSEKTQETAKLLINIFEETGFPKGLINVVLGGEDIAGKIISHKSVAKIIFTGSSNTGMKVAELCGLNFKPCILELGGNNPAIICENVDIDLCINALIWSALYSNSRSCVGTNVIFVHIKIYEMFLEKFIKHIKEVKIGNPFEECTEMSANQNFSLPYHLEKRLEEIIENAEKTYSVSENIESKNSNAKNMCKIIANSKSVENILNENFQAPLIFVQSYNSLNRVIETINDSQFGLSATIWNKNISEAKKIAARLMTGMVWINDTSVGTPKFAWGGIKRSGWGRLYSQTAITELTNIKTISIDHQLGVFNKSWWFPYSNGKYELFYNVNGLYGKNKIKVLLRILKSLFFN